MASFSSLLERTLLALFGLLRPGDRISLIRCSRDSRISYVSGPDAGDPTLAVRSILRTSPDGPADLGGGLALAYRVARRSFLPGADNRVVLLTDRSFLVGTRGLPRVSRPGTPSPDRRLLDTLAAGAEEDITLSILFLARPLQDYAQLLELAGIGGGRLHLVTGEAYIDRVLVGHREVWSEGIRDGTFLLGYGTRLTREPRSLCGSRVLSVSRSSGSPPRPFQQADFLPPGSGSTLLLDLEEALPLPAVPDSMLVRGMLSGRTAQGDSLEVVRELTMGDIELRGSPGLRFHAAVARLGRRLVGPQLLVDLPAVLSVGHDAARELGKPEWEAELRLLGCLLHRREIGFHPADPKEDP